MSDNSIASQLQAHSLPENAIPLAFRHLKPIKRDNIPKIKAGVLYEVEGSNKANPAIVPMVTYTSMLTGAGDL